MPCGMTSILQRHPLHDADAVPYLMHSISNHEKSPLAVRPVSDEPQWHVARIPGSHAPIAPSSDRCMPLCTPDELPATQSTDAERVLAGRNYHRWARKTRSSQAGLLWALTHGCCAHQGVLLAYAPPFHDVLAAAV